MTDLSTPPTRHFPRRIANSDMPPAQARQEAQRLLTTGLSAHAEKMIDWLSIGGAMTVWQITRLGLRERTLQKYSQRRVLDRLPIPALELIEAFSQNSLPPDKVMTRNLVYTLGPVGLEIARMRHEFPPLTGYLAYPIQRTIHDLLTNEIVWRLGEYAQKQGWKAEWFGKYEASLLDGKGNAILEPDTMLVLRHGTDIRHYLLEVHCEDKRARAMRKVKHYEEVCRGKYWKEQWDVDAFPPVIAVFGLSIVGKGYQKAVDDLGKAARVHYFGKTTTAFMEGKIAEWFCFNDQSRTEFLAM